MARLTKERAAMQEPTAKSFIANRDFSPIFPTEAVEKLISRTDLGAALDQMVELRKRVGVEMRAGGPEGRQDLRLLDAAIENLKLHTE